MPPADLAARAAAVEVPVFFVGERGIASCAPLSEIACAFRYDTGECIVIVRRGTVPESVMEDVIIHEKAHCLGWPDDHPGYVVPAGYVVNAR